MDERQWILLFYLPPVKLLPPQNRILQILAGQALFCKSMAVKQTVVKLHTRWYYTPSKLHRFYPVVPENCFSDCPDRSTHLHIFWNCGAIKSIWQRVSAKVALITGMQLTPTYQMCLLFADISEISPPEQKLVHTLFGGVHWSNALFWRTPWDQILKHMVAIQFMERAHHTIFDTMPIYNRKWEHWLEYGFVVI